MRKLLPSLLPSLLLLPTLVLGVACGDKDGGGDDSGPADTGGPGDTGAASGDTGVPQRIDADGDGYTVEEGDCDDAVAEVFPGATEVCNGVDDNCNEVVDEGSADTDDDGVADCVDEETCDGVDNDGDGEIDEDFPDTDGDGVADCTSEEICDGVDNDGDGEVDEGFDLDGDGVTTCADAPDCDDGDADVSPEADEIVDDLVDNDCDGLVDEGAWRFGDLVITEIMSNPQTVADPDGEWLELLNTTDRVLYLNGLSLESDPGELHDVQADVLVEVGPGERIVLGANDDLLTNGDVPVDYVYDGLSLSNEADSLALYAGAVLLDSVTWDDGVSMPDVAGASMALDVLFQGASDNDDPDAWCASTEPWADGDLGSPGGENPYCPTTDHDGDGYGIAEGDCDDDDPSVGPDAEEIWYDGFDQDCDEASDFDADGDGYDSADYGGADCDDSDAEISPDAVEICDERDTDEDCNGLADDDDPDVTDAETLYPDADGDGWGADGSPTVTCESPEGYGEGDGDCDDTDATVYPGATDTWYDGVDQDCDEASDFDADGDGYDSADHGGTDCDDLDADVNPGQVEVCDDLDTDEDCNGLADDGDPGVTDALTYYPDGDGDGFGSDADAFPSCEERDGYETSGGDCDDDDATVYPGATDTWYDGVDQDCDGRSDYDADRDGFDAEDEGGDDCDDTDPAVFPWAWEDARDDVDNDCDGAVDGDDADVPTRLSLGDDDTEGVRLFGDGVTFCGETWDALTVSSNGLVSFSSSTTSYSESARSFNALGFPVIAGWWDDLNPSSGGTVWAIEYDDAVGIYYNGVYEYGTSDGQTFAVIVTNDGEVVLAYGDMGATDGLSGWTCGDGDAEEIDLTDDWGLYEGVLGTGTEGGLFEVFTSASPSDVEDQGFRFCGTGGTDLDGDGWTAECGDPDDDDASVTP